MPVKMCNGYDGRRKCGNYAVAGSRYCEEHQDTPKEYERQRSARRREKQKGSYKTKRYLMARRRRLYLNPLCGFQLEDGTECGRLATEVHHIHHLEHGGDLYALENLRSLCSFHHQEQHRIDERRGGGRE
jgi:5-methylcytosine-specific restriction endonuclease McrA